MSTRNTEIPETIEQTFQSLYQNFLITKSVPDQKSFGRKLLLYKTQAEHNLLNDQFLNFFKDQFKNQNIPGDVFVFICDELHKKYPELPLLSREDRRYTGFKLLYGAQNFQFLQRLKIVNMEKFPKSTIPQLGTTSAQLDESSISYIQQNYQNLLSSSNELELKSVSNEISQFVKNCIPQTAAVCTFKHDDCAYILILGLKQQSPKNPKYFVIQNIEIQNYEPQPIQEETEAPIPTHDSDDSSLMFYDPFSEEITFENFIDF